MHRRGGDRRQPADRQQACGISSTTVQAGPCPPGGHTKALPHACPSPRACSSTRKRWSLSSAAVSPANSVLWIFCMSKIAQWPSAWSAMPLVLNCILIGRFIDVAGSIDAGAVSEVVLPSKTGSKAVSLADTSEQIQAVEEQSAGLSFQVAASTAAELNQSKSKKNVGFNSSVHGRNKYHVVSRQVSLLLQRQ